MRARKRPPRRATFKVGETYVERGTGLRVTVVDHEMKRGRRTGSLVVEITGCAGAGQRWAVRPTALAVPPPDDLRRLVPIFEKESEPTKVAIPVGSLDSAGGAAAAGAGNDQRDGTDDSWIWGGP